MSSSNHIRKIAIVGATGSIGKHALTALLENPSFHITAIQRSNSSLTSKLPDSSNLTVVSGDLADKSFLISALKDHEALINVLGFMVPPNVQDSIIEAAAEAGVEWFIPTEFGSDTAHPVVEQKQAMMVSGKKLAREKIAAKGMKWIAIVTNMWLDYCLPLGLFSISAPSRTATLVTGAIAPFNVSTMSSTGKAIAGLLALPKSSPDGKDLASKANRHVYVATFRVTQQQILESVQRATKTEASDWQVGSKDVDELMAEAEVKARSGDMSAVGEILLACSTRDGYGGDLEKTRGLSNREFGMPEWDLDEVVSESVEGWREDSDLNSFKKE